MKKIVQNQVMVVELFSFSNPFLFRITPCSKKMPITSFVTNLLPSFLYKHYFPTKKIALFSDFQSTVEYNFFSVLRNIPFYKIELLSFFYVCPNVLLFLLSLSKICTLVQLNSSSCILMSQLYYNTTMYLASLYFTSRVLVVSVLVVTFCNTILPHILKFCNSSTFVFFFLLLFLLWLLVILFELD